MSKRLYVKNDALQSRMQSFSNAEYELVAAGKDCSSSPYRDASLLPPLSPLPFLLETSLSHAPISYRCWHKLMDLAFGACGLLAMCLLLPILAPLIYLDSPGSIFYGQERVGYRGRTFRILKFRSMSTCAKPGERAAWVARGDARVSRVGRLLRATHLDELPQSLNILHGDMSLIGPRPERPEYVATLQQQNPLYCYRLSVKPGITGWAQVKYGYGSGEQDELAKLQYDLFYIKHQSFFLDIHILLKTVREVVLCHGI